MTIPKPDPARSQRHTTHILTLLLRAHPDLPVIDWTVTPHGLTSHIDIPHHNPDHSRKVFTTWATALDLTQYPDPEPVPDPLPTTHLRAHRHINGVLVILTATIHPF